MTISALAHFFLICTILNVFILIISSAVALFGQERIYEKHGKRFKMERERFNGILYSYLAAYKLVVFAFNVVPYIALSMMV